MTGPKGNTEFCFPETLNVPRGEAEGNIEGRELESFVRPRALESFHQWHVTHSPPIRKRI